jgi:rhodanese-related sulfurtransferase
MPTNKDIYVYCKLGKRALIGMTYAKRAGYTNRFVIMRGGMNQTIHEGYPLVPYTE